MRRSVTSPSSHRARWTRTAPGSRRRRASSRCGQASSIRRPRRRWPSGRAGERPRSARPVAPAPSPVRRGRRRARVPERDVPGGHSDSWVSLLITDTGASTTTWTVTPDGTIVSSASGTQGALVGGLRDDQRHPHGGLAEQGPPTCDQGATSGDIQFAITRPNGISMGFDGTACVQIGRAGTSRRSCTRWWRRIESGARGGPIARAIPSCMRPLAAAALLSLASASCRTQAADDRPPSPRPRSPPHRRRARARRAARRARGTSCSARRPTSGPSITG